MDKRLHIIIGHTPCVVICPQPERTRLLASAFEAGVPLDVTWMTRETLIGRLLGEPGPLALSAAASHLDTIVDIAADMLGPINAVKPGTVPDTPRLKTLFDLKDALEREGHLKPAEDAGHVLGNRPVIVSGYPMPDKQFQAVLDTLSETNEVLTLERPSMDDLPVTFEVHEDRTSEIVGLAHRIAQRIDGGCPPSKIKVHATDLSDHPMIEVVFSRFGLKADIRQGTALSTLALSKVVFERDPDAKTMRDDHDALRTRLEKHIRPSMERAREITSLILGVTDPYLDAPGRLHDYHDVLSHTLENTFLPPIPDSKSIFVGDLTRDIPDVDDHVHVINVNAGTVPKTVHDTGTFSDHELRTLGLDTPKEMNRLASARFLDLIRTQPSIHLSRRRTDRGEPRHPSPLLDAIGRPVVFAPKSDPSVSYSKLQDMLTLSSILEENIAYGTTDPRLPSLYGTLGRDLPTPYDNSFTGLSKDTLETLMTGVKTMSYSRLNTYFECPFKFYMSHMLSADPMDEETIQLRLGTFFHDVLKDYVTLPEDDDALRSALEDRLSVYLSDKKDMPETETFVLKESLGQLFGVIRFIRAIEGDSMFDVDHTEQRVSLPLPGKHIKMLVGTIDKILKAGDECNTYVLIDYKTGSAHHPLVHVKDGLDAQIVFYLLFLMRTKAHPTIAGFYYQNIHTNPLKAKTVKTYQDLLHEKWRLDGYSLDDPDIVRMIDSRHDERNTFAHYRLKKDGTPTKHSWIYDHDTLVKMTADFDHLIHQSIKAIEDGRFPVSPATIHTSNVTRPGCMYCPFKDICRLSLNDDRPVASDDPLRADASESEDERDDA